MDTIESTKKYNDGIRYYCSGFDVDNAFGHSLGGMFLRELKNRGSIVYIPGDPDKIDKVRSKYVPAFIEHFKKIGIEFDNNIIVMPDMSPKEAQRAVRNADFVMLMGGNPLKQKAMCEELGLLEELKKYDGIMLGFSAGAMLMSKYIIIIPCSEEYPDFCIEEGLNLDGISILPHNNTSEKEYPDTLAVEGEVYLKQDLIKANNQCGEYYLLQDYLIDDGLTDVSFIKSVNGNLEFFHENDGKIWRVKDGYIKHIFF